jgi:hypothetical protein
VGPRAVFDDVEKRKFLTLPGLELRPLSRQPVTIRYTDYAIPAPNFYRGKLITILQEGMDGTVYTIEYEENNFMSNYTFHKLTVA